MGHSRNEAHATSGIGELQELGPLEGLKRFLQTSQRDDVPGFTSERAFRSFLALFPAFIFLGAIGSILASLLGINNPAEQIASSLSNVYGVPGGVSALMIWFHITAFALLLAAEVNAVADKIEEPKRV